MICLGSDYFTAIIFLGGWVASHRIILQETGLAWPSICPQMGLLCPWRARHHLMDLVFVPARPFPNHVLSAKQAAKPWGRRERRERAQRRRRRRRRAPWSGASSSFPDKEKPRIVGGERTQSAGYRTGIHEISAATTTALESTTKEIKLARPWAHDQKATTHHKMARSWLHDAD